MIFVLYLNLSFLICQGYQGKTFFIPFASNEKGKDCRGRAGLFQEPLNFRIKKIHSYLCIYEYHQLAKGMKARYRKNDNFTYNKLLIIYPI